MTSKCETCGQDTNSLFYNKLDREMVWIKHTTDTDPEKTVCQACHAKLNEDALKRTDWLGYCGFKDSPDNIWID